jgi:hypothetical protein
MRKLLTVLAAIGLVSLLACPASAADGLPVPALDTGPQGVESVDGQLRYLTLPAGGGTVVAQIEQEGGRARESRYLGSEFTVPAVAVNGSTGGLSADGSTLVLIRPRVSFPQRETELAVLDAQTLRERERITLDGDFSFDAISPDGCVLYLIEYLSARDPTDYRLRAYDLGDGGGLRPQPLLDPSESPEEMRGLPIDRATGVDGRWEYTLYDGGGKEPFVHALDTVEGTTVCIDLVPLEGRRAYRLGIELSADGQILNVIERGEAVAAVDTETLEVIEPDRPEVEESTAGIWATLGLVAAGIALIAGSVLRRRRALGD